MLVERQNIQVCGYVGCAKEGERSAWAPGSLNKEVSKNKHYYHTLTMSYLLSPQVYKAVLKFKSIVVQFINLYFVCKNTVTFVFLNIVNIVQRFIYF